MPLSSPRFRFSEMFENTLAIAHRHMNPIEQAKEFGTLNAVDRSRQYTRPENSELLRSLNEAWSKIRTLEQGSRKKDLEITELRTDKTKLFKLLSKVITWTCLLTVLGLKGLELASHLAR